MMERLKRIKNNAITWAKIIFVWCMINMPVCIVLDIIYVLTGFNKTVRGITFTLCFLWGLFTSQVILKKGGDLIK